MSVTPVVLSASEYESRLQRYLFERAEEGRAVRVGEKEVSERAEIVARYAELFTRDQLEALRESFPLAMSWRRCRRPSPGRPKATSTSGSTGCARPARPA